MVTTGALVKRQMTGPHTPGHAHTATMLVAVFVTVLAALGSLAFAGWHYELSRAAAHEVLFVVPKGTAVAQASGKDSEMLPKRLWLYVGEYDTLVIRNDDDFPVRIGPFKLEAGQRYHQRFRTEGVVQLVCSTMYHEEQIQIVVMNGSNVFHRLMEGLFRS